MNKFKKIITSKIFTAASFAVAAGLLVFSSISGTRAAMTYYSQNYTSRLQMYDIGVTISENGKPISYRNYVPYSNYVWDTHRGMLLEDMIPAGEEFKLGKKYKEVLTIANTGMDENTSINTYSRVIIYKYWVDKNKDKITDLDPSLIHIEYENIGTDWLIDQDASTDERTVLYYTKCLKAGESSTPFTKSISVDGIVARDVTQTKEVTTDPDGTKWTTITTEYNYDDATFIIEAVVNSIQDHSAEKAAVSVWGREISIADDGTLSLK